MPWHPRISEAQAREAIAEADSWAGVLERLGYRYHGKNINTIRRWATTWGIPHDHLTDRRGQRHQGQRYSDQELRDAVGSSRSWAETLRRLDYCPTGGNWKTLKRVVKELGLSTEHFDPHAAGRERSRRMRTPLEDVLVEGSQYSRTNLKQRIFREGVKARRCEVCGQGEEWRGRRMSLILDHINGVRDDNRLQNLRIVCPNCAATLDTHCGRNQPKPVPVACRRCGTTFVPNRPQQQYCSQECGVRWDRSGRPLLGARRCPRPPRDQLVAEVKAVGYRAVGRKYGVSDNAIRKWERAYEREADVNPAAP